MSAQSKLTGLQEKFRTYLTFPLYIRRDIKEQTHLRMLRVLKIICGLFMASFSFRFGVRCQEMSTNTMCRQISSSTSIATLLLSVNMRWYRSGGREASIEIYSRKRRNPGMLKWSELHSMIESGELTEFKMDKNRTTRVCVRRLFLPIYVIACLVCMCLSMQKTDPNQPTFCIYQ